MPALDVTFGKSSDLLLWKEREKERKQEREQKRKYE
jgi:hypothetical protein